MTELAGVAAADRGFVVLREVEPGLWQLIGDVDRRPGLAERAARARAVRDAVGEISAGGTYAALHRDEWQVVRHG